MLVNLLLGANLLTLVLLWACCATTWLDPTLHPRVAAVGLVFPVFLVLNLLFLPLWLVCRARMVVVPLVGMALCGGYILDYCPLHFASRADRRADLRVLTWNCHNMAFYGGDSLRLALDYLKGSGADIICLQEYGFGEYKYHDFQPELEAMGYQVANNQMDMVISRLPILATANVSLDSKTANTAVQVDVRDGEDTVTIFCVHLESYSLSPDEKDDYGRMLRAPERDLVGTEVSYLSEKIGAATSYRARQARQLVARLDSLPEGRPVLLCGDFNDTPISYVYQTLSRHLRSAYRSGGCGVGISYNERNFPFRIDHVFHTAHWRCTHAHIDRQMQASDHYPLVVSLEKQGK